MGNEVIICLFWCPQPFLKLIFTFSYCSQLFKSNFVLFLVPAHLKAKRVFFQQIFKWILLLQTFSSIFKVSLTVPRAFCNKLCRFPLFSGLFDAYIASLTVPSAFQSSFANEFQYSLGPPHILSYVSSVSTVHGPFKFKIIFSLAITQISFWIPAQLGQKSPKLWKICNFGLLCLTSVYSSRIFRLSRAKESNCKFFPMCPANGSSNSSFF